MIAVMRKLTLLILLLLVAPRAFAQDVNTCLVPYYNQEPSAFEMCKPFAENGDMNAQKALGDMYYWGWGDAIVKDYDQAVNWYKKAAKEGHTDAKYNLGVMYEMGQGVMADYAGAIKWYTSAANDGHVLAQFNLGNMYTKGAGVKQDPIQAAKWYLRAANQGDDLAQYNLGNRYANGIGVAQDLAEAYKWFTISGRQGNESAKANREIIIGSMNDAQIAQGRELAESWKPMSESRGQKADGR